MSANNEIDEFNESNALTAGHMNEIVKKVNIWADIKDVRIVASKPATLESDVLYFIKEEKK